MIGPVVGRFGQVVNRMIGMAGFNATVRDHDLAAIHLMRQFGFKTFLGNPTRADHLHAAGIKAARVLVAAMDDRHATTRIVRDARGPRPDLHIVARAHDRVHVYDLYEADADDIVREMFDSSLRAARDVLENMGLSGFETAEMEKLLYRMDPAAMLDLAKLWTPGVPIADNPDYITRARQLNKAFETALAAQRDDRIDPDSRADGDPTR